VVTGGQHVARPQIVRAYDGRLRFERRAITRLPFATGKACRTRSCAASTRGEWKPGDLIPNEADLALEFGCARTTVNRALRALAETGLLDRRRKAGTRVAAQPVAKATLDIAVIRQEVEARGQTYSYRRIARAEQVPPTPVSATNAHRGRGAASTRARPASGR